LTVFLESISFSFDKFWLFIKWISGRLYRLLNANGTMRQAMEPRLSPVFAQANKTFSPTWTRMHGRLAFWPVGRLLPGA
jgi:hypothetical protein